MKKKQLFLTLGLLINTLQISASAGGVAGPAAGGVTHTGAPEAAPAMAQKFGEDPYLAAHKIKFGDIAKDTAFQAEVEGVFRSRAKDKSDFVNAVLDDINSYNKTDKIRVINRWIKFYTDQKNLFMADTDLSEKDRKKFVAPLDQVIATLNSKKLLVEMQPE